MSKLLFSLILIFSLTASCDLIPKKQGPVLTGELHKDFYPNGKLKSVCQVDNKKRNGTCNTYYESGKLKSTAEYKMNKFHGMYITYYENGNKMSEVSYLDHKKEGASKLYYTSGNIRVIENYVDGELNGIKQKFYPKGKLQMENLYKNGKPSINLKEYDAEGSLILERPKILIKAIDRVALENTYILKISLSNKSRRVKYYLGEITDDGYTPYYMIPIETKNGVGTLEFPVYRGTMLMKKMSIIAKWKTTQLGNTCVLNRSYNLAVKY